MIVDEAWDTHGATAMIGGYALAEHTYLA